MYIYKYCVAFLTPVYAGGFWLAISFRFSLIICQLGCYRVFQNVRSGEVGD
jgi:hypothetical protein